MLRPRKPLLIVPIRDRRQRRRILTIKNCAITMLSVAVVVATISTYNAARRAPANEYGRLFRSEVAPANATVPRKVDIIEEGAADDRGTDSMLVAPAAREHTDSPALMPAPAPRVAVASPSAIDNVRGHGTTIVGDGSGVAVVPAPTTSTAPRPVLSGGIFKQQ
ncbi:MAG TPA: hypothetical protein VGQ21_16620 [Thermoanaerobaculia bacterium]|jgi:hypothetical protein|nr:hypothetical protein [Thermoanaerobaculia bacterium]